MCYGRSVVWGVCCAICYVRCAEWYVRCVICEVYAILCAMCCVCIICVVCGVRYNICVVYGEWGVTICRILYTVRTIQCTVCIIRYALCGVWCAIYCLCGVIVRRTLYCECMTGWSTMSYSVRCAVCDIRRTVLWNQPNLYRTRNTTVG